MWAFRISVTHKEMLERSAAAADCNMSELLHYLIEWYHREHASKLPGPKKKLTPTSHPKTRHRIYEHGQRRPSIEGHPQGRGPLVAYLTADPEQTILEASRRRTAEAASDKATPVPILEWDCIRGLRGRNTPGQEAAREISPDGPAMTLNPAECLSVLVKAPDDSIVFFHNPQRLLEDPRGVAPIAQAIWNLRDGFKERRCTLVMLSPDLTLPPELRNDVITLEEASPTPEDIDRVISATAADAGVELNGEKAKAIDTLLGYGSEFAVEQSFALSLSKKGVDMDILWELKVRDLRKAAGLEVLLPKENFNDLAGCEGMKSFMRLYLNGRRSRAPCSGSMKSRRWWVAPPATLPE